MRYRATRPQFPMAYGMVPSDDLCESGDELIMLTSHFFPNAFYESCTLINPFTSHL